MDQCLSRFTLPCSFPYLHGVYLAVNAIPRTGLLIDGPVCAFTKTEQVFGTHDTRSDLLSTTSRHRVVHTRAHPDTMIDGGPDSWKAALGAMAASERLDVVIAAPFPMGVLAGSPYQNWAAAVDTCGKPVVHVPGLSLTADWLRGWSETLRALAVALPLPAAARDPGKVAVVGYFHDRNEEDHRGNLRELRRLLAALDLDLVTVWLGGEEPASLARVAEAGTIVALPLGREAARVLAGRTGACVVECDVPFGPDATVAWLRAVGEATGRADRAARVAANGLAECQERLRWLVLKRLVHGRWAFAGDPFMMAGLCDLARFVGARVKMLVAWAMHEPAFGGEREWPVPVRHGMHAQELRDLLRNEADGIDLVIGNSVLASERIVPDELGFLEFGFPSLRHHAAWDEPFLGFAGTMCLAGRIANCFDDLDLGDEAVAGMDAL